MKVLARRRPRVAVARGAGMCERRDAACRRPPAAVPQIAVLLIVMLGLAAPFVLAACGNADPFAGLYWEPSTGRRVEIRKEGDGYRLYYGAAKHAYEAVRDGDQLTIAEPMGGTTIVRPGKDGGTLELVSGGRTTLLKRLPEHQ